VVKKRIRGKEWSGTFFSIAEDAGNTKKKLLWGKKRRGQEGANILVGLDSNNCSYNGLI
jgi:hypothetical protein